ncbi:hypothetical protein ACJX0J_011243, partial [Zea mays]
MDTFDRTKTVFFVLQFDIMDAASYFELLNMYLFDMKEGNIRGMKPEEIAPHPHGQVQTDVLYVDMATLNISQLWCLIAVIILAWRASGLSITIALSTASTYHLVVVGMNLRIPSTIVLCLFVFKIGLRLHLSHFYIANGM